ncbi:DUF3265 domain-containing protein [Vibrio vulnificus]|nr:DUF3265 domain-containing protein [Vibrio vulnificus]
MTKRLSGIWHAWHFRFALGSVIKSLCGSFCSACLHPLTRRYVLITKSQLVASFLCFLGFLILVLSANWLSVSAVFWTPICGREKFRELPH